MRRCGRIFSVFILAAVAFSATLDRRGEVIPGTATTPAQAGQGMVSSAHPLATHAGLELPKAVSMPGNVHAWEAMSKEYGRLRWAQLLKSAIRLAGEGFPVNQGLAGAIENAYAAFPKQTKALYVKVGTPLKAGDTLIQKDP